MKDIYWVSRGEDPKLAIVARPRGGEWLEADLMRMKHSGIDAIVSLLTAPEAEELGLALEAATAKRLGLSFFSYPIPDRHVPQDKEEFLKFIGMLAGHIKSGQAIGVHCRGCIGRATITAASLLFQLGWDASMAIEKIEAARGCPVPDTPEQAMWILALSDYQSAR